MRAGDTSVVVAAFASWHEYHGPARRALDEGFHLIEHCALETYSVLTRLPSPHRVSSEAVREFLATRFPDPWLRMSKRAWRDFLLSLPEHDVNGGAAYDALVAATSVHCKAELLTCDRRARRVYERYTARSRILS